MNHESTAGAPRHQSFYFGVLKCAICHKPVALGEGERRALQEPILGPGGIVQIPAGMHKVHALCVRKFRALSPQTQWRRA